jgi:preprotein translocase subunit YajC
MKKLIAVISMLLTTLALAATVFAAGASGKVTKVEGDKVTVTLQGGVPAWAKKGATVSALGGAPKVMAVNGKELTLRFSKEKAAKIKVDSSLTLTKSTGELQGC